MLRNTAAFSGFSVDDADAARTFYGQTLGLEVADNPMGFLNTILGRPANERAIMLIVAGYPAPDARVPDLRRKPLTDIATFR